MFRHVVEQPFFMLFFSSFAVETMLEIIPSWLWRLFSLILGLRSLTTGDAFR
jgi:hypothetical protein